MVRLGAGGACAALRFAFGCATVESGHFRSQQADGIMGLASSTRVEQRRAVFGASSASQAGGRPVAGRQASEQQPVPTQPSDRSALARAPMAEPMAERRNMSSLQHRPTQPPSAKDREAPPARESGEAAERGPSPRALGARAAIAAVDIQVATQRHEHSMHARMHACTMQHARMHACTMLPRWPLAAPRQSGMSIVGRFRVVKSPELDVTGQGRAGLDWTGLDWTGLGWAGLGWAGLGWAGLDETGLHWTGLGLTGLDWTGLVVRRSPTVHMRVQRAGMIIVYMQPLCICGCRERA